MTSAANRSDHHVVFELESTRYALPLDGLIEVSWRVHVTPLPAAPAIVLGLIVHRGVGIPAIDLRSRLGLSARPATLGDQMLVVRTARRVVALVVDGVASVAAIDPQSVRSPLVTDRHVRGVVVVDGSLVLIEDLEALLSLEEEHALDAALAQREGP